MGSNHPRSTRRRLALYVGSFECRTGKQLNCGVLTERYLRNQTGNLDGAIEDVLEHFVYEPRKCTANPQDIPFFLSTRLTTVDTVPDETSKTNAKVDQVYESTEESDPAKVLKRYENRAAELAAEFEESMVRF
eukprot:scaffold68194_cov58-Attheya_sp.AAC.5